MTRPPTAPAPVVSRRYDRESLEFARVANLSDAVFAIAMTLLVLTLERPDVPVDQLAGALRDDLPQVVAFVLAFALVANLWWQHHRLLSRLAWLEPGMIGWNLVLLGAVALVPFPTSLIGSAPTARAAVLPFVGVFLALLVLYLALTLRAQSVAAWSTAVPPAVFHRVVAGYLAVGAMMLGAVAVGLVIPLAGLAVLAASNLPQIIILRRGPAAYRDWL